MLLFAQVSPLKPCMHLSSPRKCHMPCPSHSSYFELSPFILHLSQLTLYTLTKRNLYLANSLATVLSAKLLRFQMPNLCPSSIAYVFPNITLNARPFVRILTLHIFMMRSCEPFGQPPNWRTTAFWLLVTVYS